MYLSLCIYISFFDFERFRQFSCCLGLAAPQLLFSAAIIPFKTFSNWLFVFVMVLLAFRCLCCGGQSTGTGSAAGYNVAKEMKPKPHASFNSHHHSEAAAKGKLYESSLNLCFVIEVVQRLF